MPEIVNTLELHFAKPEHIIKRMMEQTNLNTFMDFASETQKKNCCVSLRDFADWRDFSDWTKDMAVIISLVNTLERTLNVAIKRKHSNKFPTINISPDNERKYLKWNRELRRSDSP